MLKRFHRKGLIATQIDWFYLLQFVKRARIDEKFSGQSPCLLCRIFQRATKEWNEFLFVIQK